MQKAEPAVRQESGAATVFCTEPPKCKMDAQKGTDGPHSMTLSAEYPDGCQPQ